MAYGMELDPVNGVTTIKKSFNGDQVGAKVDAINGTHIAGFSKGRVRELVNALAETRQNIRLLLEGGSIVIYSPNSAPQDWDRLRQTEQA